MGWLTVEGVGSNLHCGAGGGGGLGMEHYSFFGFWEKRSLDDLHVNFFYLFSH